MVQRESQNSPELITLPLLHLPISLSSGKGEQVGVIPQMGRMEVSKIVIGKSLSPPTWCVNEHIAGLVNLHKQNMKPTGQNCSVVNEIRCLERTLSISARMTKVRHQFIHLFIRYL